MTRPGQGRILAILALGLLPANAAPSPGATAPRVAATSVFSLAGQPVQGGWLRGVAPPRTVVLRLDGASVSFAPDGAFFLAFDRDAKPGATLEAVLADGRKVTEVLAVAPRAWRIERVNVPLRPPATPDADYQRIRTAELARIAAARTANSASEGWRQRFIWPVRGRISGLFGSQRIYQGVPASYHSGTDVSTGHSGTPFVAPADGIVILAAESPFSLEGNLLMIDHGMGLNSAFLHGSKLLVKAGDSVRQGQVIGLIGMSGRASGPHLHWSVKWHEARLDPMLLSGPMG